MHWHISHVSILVHITYKRLMPFVDDIIQDQDENLGGWVKEVHFYISNDTQHDSLFVQHYFIFQWEHMTSRDQVLSIRHWVWFYGCAT
jgi:hypothetical protein